MKLACIRYLHRFYQHELFGGVDFVCADEKSGATETLTDAEIPPYMFTSARAS